MEKAFKLPIDFAEKWLGALRDGTFKQGTASLVSISGKVLAGTEPTKEDCSFCCLGVGAYISNFSINSLGSDSYLISDDFCDVIPDEILGSDDENAMVRVLASLNDGIGIEEFNTLPQYIYRDENWIKPDETGEVRFNFSQIADFIEDNTVFYNVAELQSNYTPEHQARLKSETRLRNCEHKTFHELYLGETYINISGKECKVKVTRNDKGNIEITPIDEGIRAKGGWLYQGTCTEGYNDEVIITQFLE